MPLPAEHVGQEPFYPPKYSIKVSGDTIFIMLKLLKSDLAIIFFLLLVSAPLRFINLGYSEYQDDEKKALLRVAPNESVYNFLIQQRKGPMQFFVSYIPYMITGDFRNELAERLPFTLMNTASVIVIYLLLEKVTKDKLASVFGCLIYSTNGFIVGFSRIAQYQNLNLFFSLLALYLYSFVVDSKKHLTKRSLLATLLFCLSILSHWDAIFYLVPIIYFFIKFLIRKDLNVFYKIRLVLVNLVVGSLILLPLLLPYINYHSRSAESVEYFGRRIDFSTYSLDKHRFVFELYNPYFTLPIYLTLGIMSLFFFKKNFVYLVWFLINFLTIRYFMAKPGTHIYNYIIPAVFAFSFFISGIASKIPIRSFKILFGLIIFLIPLVLFYQSYVLFVDHTQEYPWDEKKLFGFVTRPYKEKEILTFGFPHFRDWKRINDFTQIDGKECGYTTNEGKEVSQIYLDIKYGSTKGCYYVITVKRPFVSTRDGVSFPQAKNKYLVYKYKDDEETLTKVYKIPFNEIQ